ncbi:MAG: hypothetical protein AAGE01_04450 [Pseudomonadota bacterium]
MSILGAVGNTPTVELRHLVAHGGARVVAELESLNPTDGVTGRMALGLSKGGIHRRREEGILTGNSSGANVVAALCQAGRLVPQGAAVTRACDTGPTNIPIELFEWP